MTTLKLNISNENYKNLKKICSDKIDSKNKRIVKYYKLNTKKPEICPFCKENNEHIHIHGYYLKCLKNLKTNTMLDLCSQMPHFFLIRKKQRISVFLYSQKL